MNKMPLASNIKQFPMLFLGGIGFAYIWSSNIASSLYKKYKSKKTITFIGFLKILALAGAIALIFDLRNSIPSISLVTKLPRDICYKDSALPTMLICPKASGNRTYGLLMNETKVVEFGLTDVDIDLMAQWKMTGKPISNVQQMRIMNKVRSRYGVANLEDVWFQIHDLKHFSHTLERSVGDIDIAGPYHNGSGGPECANGQSRNYDPNFYPVYEIFDKGNPSFPRRVWFTPFKSRCIYMQKDTHHMTQWIAIKFFIGGYWIWFGDLNVTELKPNSFLYEAEGSKYGGETSLGWDVTRYEMRNSPVPLKEHCNQNILKLDGGEIFNTGCAKNPSQLRRNYYLHEISSQQTSKMPHGMGSISLEVGNQYLVERVDALTPYALVQLSVGFIDIFLGISVFYIFELLFEHSKCLKKLKKVQMLVLELAVIGLLLAPAGFLVYRDWRMQLQTWYLNKFELVEMNQEGGESVPSFYLDMKPINFVFGPYNFTLLDQHKVSIPLLEFISMVAYSKSFDGWVWGNENCPSGVNLPCSKNLTTCVWERIPDLTAFVCGREFYPVVRQNLNLLYGERYKSAKDFESLIGIVKQEYLDLSNKLAGKELLPHELASLISVSPCALIITCSIAGTEIPNCCKAWRLSPSYFSKKWTFYNDGQSIPVLKLHGPGKQNGLQLVLDPHEVERHGNMKRFRAGAPNGIKVRFGGRFPKEPLLAIAGAGGARYVSRIHDFKVTAPQTAYVVPGAVVDINLERGLDRKVPYHDCTPFDYDKRDFACYPPLYLIQAVMIKICGCKFCTDEFLLKPFQKNDVKCCSADQAADCMTSKNLYDKGCAFLLTDKKPIFNEFIHERATGWQPHKEDYKPCRFQQMRSFAVPGNPFFLSEKEFEILDEKLGFKLYNSTSEMIACPQLCDFESFSATETIHFTGKSTKPGRLEVNIYTSSTDRLDFVEEVRFSIFQFLVVLFSAWSMFFNQSFIVVFGSFTYFIFKVIQVVKGNHNWSSILENENSEIAGVENPNIEVNPRPTGSSVTAQEAQKIDEDLPGTSNQRHSAQGAQKIFEDLPGTSNQRHDATEDLRRGSSGTYNSRTVAMVEFRRGSPGTSKQRNEAMEDLRNDSPQNDVITVEQEQHPDIPSNQEANPANPKAKSKFHKNIFGANACLSIGLLTAAIWLFSMNLVNNPYSTIMSASDNQSLIPIPSVALCMSSKGSDVQNMFLGMNLQCHLKGSMNKICASKFNVFFRRNGYNCLLMDDRNIINDKSVDHNQHGLTLTEPLSSNRQMDIFVWIGDALQLAQQNSRFQSSFIWKPRQAYDVTYTVFQKVEPSSMCFNPADVSRKCEECASAALGTGESYLCCNGGDSKSVVINVVASRSGLPCASHSYVLAPVIDYNFNVSLNSGRIQMKSKSSFMRSFQRQDRYTSKGIFLILTTYWGMFVGITFFQMLVIIVSICLKCCKTSSVSAEDQNE